MNQIRPLSLFSSKKDTHFQDKLFFAFILSMVFLVFCLLAGFLYLLIDMSIPTFNKFGFKFFVSSDWNPITEEFGALAFAYGTLVSSFIALLLSTPISVGAAIVLTELAPRKLAAVFGFLVEMLAAIPSVVYGLWGIFVLAPWLRSTVQPFLGQYFGFIPLFEGPPFGIGMMAAGVILAIMITPTITSICREVFRAVPIINREAALGLGATRWETIKLAVLTASRTGILSAVLLGLGRALGETMAVTMVIGNRADISLSLFAPGQTMASVLANEYAEASDEIHLSSLAAVGFALFIVSIMTNSLARLIAWGMNKEARVKKVRLA